jgi:CheY-like chemotaxis protein
MPSGRRVLLVDDIKINLDIIGSFLNTAGHAVVLTESGQEAVTSAAEQRFDLILRDLRLPEMDGLEATRRIRMLPGAHGAVPILALTAHTSLDQVANCLDAGMDGHVPKPVDYETLMRAVDEVLTRAPAARIARLYSAAAEGRPGDDSAGWGGDPGSQAESDHAA